MNYYYIRTSYKEHPKLSAHVVKAKSEEEAVSIAERHRISNPFGTNVVKREPRLLVLTDRFDSNIIDRRKRGVGGKIFYEENGKLKIEKS